MNCSNKGRWVKAHLKLPTDILTSQVDTTIPVIIENFDIASEMVDVFVNDEGKVQVDASFSRETVCSALEVIGGNSIELNVSARLTNGEYIFGKDTIGFGL